MTGQSAQWPQLGLSFAPGACPRSYLLGAPLPVLQELLLTLKRGENMCVIASPGGSGLLPNSLPGGPAGQSVQGALENLPLPGRGGLAGPWGHGPSESHACPRTLSSCPELGAARPSRRQRGTDALTFQAQVILGIRKTWDLPHQSKIQYLSEIPICPRACVGSPSGALQPRGSCGAGFRAADAPGS